MTHDTTPADSTATDERLSGPGAGVIGGRSARRSAVMALAVVAALTALADTLFYGHVVGWTAGLYAAALLIGVWIVNPAAQRRGDRPAIVLSFAIVSLALAMAHDPTVLRVAMCAAAVLALSMTCRLGWTHRAVEWAERAARFALGGWMRIGVDAAVLRRASARRRVGPRVCNFHAGRWVVPVMLSGVFVALFSEANPLIERWVSDAGDWASRIPRLFELARVVMWAMVGAWVWALLRPRRVRIDLRTPPVMEWDAATGRLVPASIAVRRPGVAFGVEAIVRCLILFNAVFAVETIADVLVIASNGRALPPGMEYSEYARRGAYPLLAAAILAAVFVLVTFAGGASGPRWRTARLLVYAWLAQNVLLVASAAWRLSLYVEAFHLTRWRIAAAIWMVLVAVGLLSIVIRIVRERDNAWLLRANAAALAAVLYACCFVSFDRLIADYNVAHSRELGGHTRADVAYLGGLGHDAIPALDRLVRESADTDKAGQARGVLIDLRAALVDDTANWRGWTWNRARLAQP